jgi:tetratricopeptide (TPR) repeat protein
MTTRCLTAVALASLVVLAGPAAAADDDPNDAKARELFRRAEAHFGAGELEQARQLYTRAYELRPLPGFLFNIAQCHHFNRQHERALFFYRSYLARLPDAHNRAEVERLIAATEAELARLRRERAADKPRPSPAPPAAVEAREPPTRAWLIAGASASAALLVTGAVTGGLSIARSREYNDPATESNRLSDLRSSGRALAATSVATLATGALLGAGTIIYWRVSYVPRARAARASAAVVPLAEGGAALVLGGRF